MDTSMNSAIRASIPLLTTCLAKVYPAATLDSLHVVLMSTLSAHLAPTWQPEHPTRGSTVRSMLLSPKVPAPAPIQAAADATGVQVRDWVLLLTRGDAYEICIDPGLVSYRVGNATSTTVYWQSRGRTPSATQRLPWDVVSPVIRVPKTPTYETMAEPDWMTSLLSRFPDTPRQKTSVSSAAVRRPALSSPASSDRSVSPPLAPARYVPPHRAPSMHTRTPSEVSTSLSTTSSMYSALSLSMSQLSVSSTEASSAVPSTRSSSPVDDCALVYDYESDEEESRVVYIDSSRKEVTEYECGKVGVLGGAVMLGRPQKGSAIRPIRLPRLQH